VYKKGDKLKAKSYRPIALSCTARRIYEKLLARNLNPDLLSPFQGGFRKNRNTFHQIWTLDLLLKNNKNLHTCFMDLEAAYDTVNRDILYMKLFRNYNVDVNTIYRIQSLFENVTSRLLLKGESSAPIKNERGLLQGSSLSPILFNFFINDLLGNLQMRHPGIFIDPLSVNSLGFADDLCVISKTKLGLQKILDDCAHWSDRNGLRFSPAKCVLLQKDTRLTLYNQPLLSAKSAKYLGIYFKRNGIDTSATLKERCGKGKQISNLLASVGMHGMGFSQQASAKLYKQFVRPTIEYGFQVMTLNTTQRKSIDMAQSASFRRIFSAPRSTSKNAMHKLLQILPLSARADQLFGKFHKQLLVADQTLPAHKIAKSMESVGTFPSNNWTDFVGSKSLTGKKIWGTLLGLDPPNLKSVSNAILMKIKPEPIHVALTADAFPNLKTRKTILTWLIGGVARHQDCQNCGAPEGLSRAHALECSGANEYLHCRFPAESKQFLDKEIGNTPLRLTFLDYLLHFHRGKSENVVEKWNFYSELTFSIGKIYEKCLKFEVDTCGFWAKPEPLDTNLAPERIYATRRRRKPP
jgi:hypothetical protein